MHPTQRAIEQGSGRKFLGGFRTAGDSTTYQKKHGDREVSRRLRNEIKTLARGAIEDIDGELVSLWDQLVASPNYGDFLKASSQRLIEIREQIKRDLAS